MKKHLKRICKGSSKNFGQKDDLLVRILCSYERLAIAFSGGLDSTVLLHRSVTLLGQENVLALTVVSPIFPREDLSRAGETAFGLGVRLKGVFFDHLSLDTFVHNPPNRCYYCKKAMYEKLLPIARKEGFSLLADGTQADDLKVYRPGLKAIRELGILTPLAEAGINKREIRTYAREKGLRVAGLPAAPCLATRFLPGEIITRERLNQVKKAEDLLRSLGFRVFRVRVFRDEARLEFDPLEFESFWQKREIITKGLKALGFSRLFFDLQGYQSS